MRRHEIPVAVVSPNIGLLRDATVSIRVKDYVPALYGVWVGDELIATCTSGKRLGDWCWAHDVLKVRYDLDLKLLENEP